MPRPSNKGARSALGWSYFVVVRVHTFQYCAGFLACQIFSFLKAGCLGIGKKCPPFQECYAKPGNEAKKFQEISAGQNGGVIQ